LISLPLPLAESAAAELVIGSEPIAALDLLMIDVVKIATESIFLLCWRRRAVGFNDPSPEQVVSRCSAWL
jgi:hypothetical protein